jgi:cell pole-organizing protein PopZ
MSELPPNIDAILASIRARMNDDAPVPPEAPKKPPEVVVKPAAAVASIGAVVLDGSAITLDGLVRSMLEPMLKAWLDANMPEIVERMAQAEIKRLTGRD